MSTNLRTAAQQALEAMEDLHRTGDTQVFDLCHRETTEALRAALKQHEKDVEWMKQRHANWRLQKELAEQTQERDRQQREYEEARSAALEQPEQAEPVASLMTNIQSGDVEVVWNDDGFDREMWHETPLYTHPPRREWRGLTDTERAEVQYESFKRGLSPLEFMELHEAVLKERNA
jgi:hypothetical protein